MLFFRGGNFKKRPFIEIYFIQSHSFGFPSCGNPWTWGDLPPQPPSALPRACAALSFHLSKPPGVFIMSFQDLHSSRPRASPPITSTLSLPCSPHWPCLMNLEKLLYNLTLGKFTPDQARACYYCRAEGRNSPGEVSNNCLHEKQVDSSNSEMTSLWVSCWKWFRLKTPSFKWFLQPFKLTKTVHGD